MGMKFGKFIKKTTIEIIVARSSFQGEVADRGKLTEEFVKNSAVLFLHPDFARERGFKEGDVVEVEKDGRILKLAVRITETAPKKGGMIPNSIYANYFVINNLKKFEASISPSNGRVTKVDELLNTISNNKIKKSNIEY